MKTRKNRKYNEKKRNVGTLFQNEITVFFFEMLVMIKIFHWKTFSFASHKATDQLYGKLNDHMDRFMEVLLGKTNPIRMHFSLGDTLKIMDLTKSELIEKMNTFKSFLVDLRDHSGLMKSMSNVDLLNIRDEILADINQFLYLFSLE